LHDREGEHRERTALELPRPRRGVATCRIPVRRTPSGLRGPAGCSARKLTDEEIRKIAQDLANQAEATTNPIAHTGIE
jgi:hypothetical protein